MTPRILIIILTIVVITAAGVAYYLTQLPDGLILRDGNALILTQGRAEFIWNHTGDDIIDVKWTIEPPQPALSKWLSENNYVYSYFDTDKTMIVGGTKENPIYQGWAVYAR